MKKILITLICLLVLAGCASKGGYSRVTDENEVIFKGPSTTYTKADLYKVLKLNSLTSFQNQIIDHYTQEKNITADDFKDEAEEYTQLMIDYGLEQTIIGYYGSKEAFTQMYQESLVQEQVIKSYIDEKFDEYIETDKPVKIQTIYFDNEETANKFIEDVNGGKEFETAATDNGFENDCAPYVSLDSDSLVYEVKEYLNTTDSTGLSTIITSQTTSTDESGNEIESVQYNIVNVLDRDAKNFKEDYLTAKAQTMSIDEILGSLIEKYDIKFYDQDLYELISTKYEGLK